jgi:ectoine hydroxylase-related dioxygenase (phytanoyl-CoA dioxygenase family)
MTDVGAAAADGLVQNRRDRVGTGQTADYGSHLNGAGYAVIADLVDGAELAEIARFADGLVCDRASTRRLIELPWCRELAARLMRDERLSGILSTAVIPVQCTLFVKSIESNWLVALHQDLSIPVAEHVESPGCQGWSEKEGELFVQPPVSVLDTVLALRLHLDDCKERNGALRVVPGSHRLGRLTTAEAIQAKDERGEVCIEVPRGGAMLMRPLLLHASSKVSIARVRRVLHFVFAPAELPGALRWPPRGRPHTPKC